jgi:hypothetical protein
VSFRSVHLSLVLLLLALGLVSCASCQPPDDEDLSFRTHELTDADDRLSVTASSDQ